MLTAEHVIRDVHFECYIFSSIDLDCVLVLHIIIAIFSFMWIKLTWMETDYIHYSAIFMQLDRHYTKTKDLTFGCCEMYRLI